MEFDTRRGSAPALLTIAQLCGEYGYDKLLTFNRQRRGFSSADLRCDCINPRRTL